MADSTETQGQNFKNILLSLAAFVIIIAGIRAAGDIIVPFLMASFIAIICSPALFWLENKRVPRGIAFIIVIGVVVAILSGVGAVVSTSISDFGKNLPEYQEKLSNIADAGIKYAEKYNFPIPRVLKSKDPQNPDPETDVDADATHNKQPVTDVLPQHPDSEAGVSVAQNKQPPKYNILHSFDSEKLMDIAQNMIARIGGLLSQTFLIFIIVAFILFETSSFPRKLAEINIIEGDDDGGASAMFTGKIKRYLAIKTITSLATAVIVAVGLYFAGVRYPFLWGMLAFFLNFIPSIGAIIAAVPVLLLTMVQFGIWRTLWVAVGYTIVNIAIGNFIEPRFMGKELGLSPLVVFLSLVFWGWVLGPVGMFLSVPLTMTAKIAFDSREDTKWIGILLGP